MEIVRVLGIDPSVRNTGIAIVEYNAELEGAEAFKVKHCQTLVNPARYTKKDAILNMLDMLQTESRKDCYQEPATVLIESPPIMFNKTWSGGTISNIAHIAGGAVALFGIEKTLLFNPTEWNRSKKKEFTHNNTVCVLGPTDKWHYEKCVKNESQVEHILDAASMALWWIKSNFIEE